MGYCHYTQLVSKCRKLEDENERIGIGLVGTGRSRRNVEMRQQTTVLAGARTDDGGVPKRGTHGDDDGTPSLVNHIAADNGCSVYGASSYEECEGSPRAGQMNRETEVCAV